MLSSLVRYSIIITAWNEAKTLALNMNNILNPSSGNLLPEMEIIIVSPDIETYNAAFEVAQKYGFKEIYHIQDERKGKPKALNLGISASRGDILIFMDGDILIGKNALLPLVSLLGENTYAASGRPVSADSKASMLGYWGNLLADAAHEKRYSSLKSSYFVSGYLYALRKFEGLEFPENVLADDGWISLKVLSLGKKIGYSPESIVSIKYPKNLIDWLKQKRRSAGGYSQLKSFYNDFSHLSLPKRSFTEEFKYLFFPIFYANSFIQLLYSLALYPIRLLLWIQIFIDRLTRKHQNLDLWVRIESTK